MNTTNFARRDFFKLLGLGTTSMAIPAFFNGCSNVKTKSNKIYHSIIEKVFNTKLIDTHEHLYKEKDRVNGKEYVGDKCNDWTMVLNHYLDSDLRSAGMPEDDYNRFFSYGPAPLEKWKLIEPYWDFVKHTGYGQAAMLSIKELYGIEELSEQTVDELQASYKQMVKPGFYKKILKEKANIESCQVNLWPVMESDMPEFLMTDISMAGMIGSPGNPDYAKRGNLPTQTLDDWHRVIDWWFTRYSKYAVAVKIGNAYSRNLHFNKTAAGEVEKTYRRLVDKQQISVEERQKLEDHIFWYVVDQANKYNLPVKIHTGYHARWAGKENYMDMFMVRNNPAEAARLCALSPETRFVFFHIGYPYYEEMLAVAKQFPNAYMDMVWSWIINPVAAKDFFKKYIVTAPANKLLPFGGDYRPVEPVLGHAIITKHGMALAFAELIDEGYITLKEANKLVDPIMYGNAYALYDLKKKYAILDGLNWNAV